MKYLHVFLLFAVISLRSQSPVIVTVAGNHAPGYLSDGVQATSTSINAPSGVAVDAAGNLYIADSENHRIRKVNSSGIISTYAGNGIPGYSGDGGPATSAQLDYPVALALDDTGNLYVVDKFNARIRKVDLNGNISTFAGNGTQGSFADGVPATSSSLNFPNGIALDKKGNVFVSDFGDAKVRKINTSGIISTIAGNGTYMNGYTGDGGPADTTSIGQPMAVACDHHGNVYIADGFSLIRKVDTLGIISTVAGSGNSFGGISGDGGPATAALLGAPGGITFDAAQNMYISDYFNHVIRIVDTSGIINSFASFPGNGSGYIGDWGPANLAKLFAPTGISTDINGDLFIADEGNDVVRKIGKCIPSTPEICMVAVDSLSLNNVIYWDKSLYAADTFYIYRDTANYNYALIGKVPYDSLGQFVDTARTLYAANGDPNASSWRYKISYGFPCPSGRSISQMSPWHQTLFMINSGGSFMWTMYQIEGQSLPVSGLVNYLFKRDNLSNGNWATIQALSASSAAYIDQAYTLFQATASWRVETSWGISCDPTRSIINTTRSNVRGIVAPPTAVGINERTTADALSVFPIPASPENELFIMNHSDPIESIDILDPSGRIVFRKTGINSFELSIRLNSLSAGCYFLRVESTTGEISGKRILIN